MFYLLVHTPIFVILSNTIKLYTKLKSLKLKNIHWKYLLYHWASTLLIAPFLVQLLMYISKANAHQIVGLIEVYPITLIFSLVLSSPTYLIYAIVDYLCVKHELPKKNTKAILISVALIGIIITFFTISKTRDIEITIGYFLTSLISGMILKLK